jgi:hypothetical protein
MIVITGVLAVLQHDGDHSSVEEGLNRFVKTNLNQNNGQNN